MAGCAPLVVHFTNTSSGAASYSWNLGNGTTSLLTDVSGSYLTPGTYTVTLTASNGSTSSVSTAVVTVYPAPTVSFYADDTAVCPGVAVNFTSTTIGGVPGAISYIWNFGDGTSSTSSSPSHVFPGPGYYNVTLFATNSEGCQSSVTLPAYIHVYTPPSPSFTAAANYFCSPPANASFTSTVSGYPGFTYSWGFGDGGSSTAADPSHTYATTGSYNVSLTVTDGHGCINEISYSAFIVVSELTASFTGPGTACENTPVSFINTSGSATSYSWNFGDGGTSLIANPTHTFTAAGIYTVTETISVGPCNATATHTITITAAPAMSILASPLEPCPAPATIDYSGSGVPAGSTILWTFGDGDSATGTTPVHTYGGSACYKVKMIVTLPSGCVDSDSIIKHIYPIIPLVIDTPSSGCVPLTVPFSLLLTSTDCFGNTILYPYTVDSFSWNFGDGSANSSSATPTHTYTAVGVYSGFVTFKTVNGCIQTASFSIAVGTPPVASFYAVPTTICADRSVSFISTSTGTITRWDWTFGDGATLSDSTPDPSHLYHIPDTSYSVTLIVYDNGCPSLPFTLTNYIHVDSPMALFTDTFICIPPTSVQFYDSSLGATSWLWMFPGGATSTQLNPSFNFDSLGIWVVKLATYNFRSGCRDTFTGSVNLFRPLPLLTFDSTICKGMTDTFYAHDTGSFTGLDFRWYIGLLDTFQYYGDSLSFKFYDSFLRSGIYTIRLVGRDGHGCLDTVNKLLLVAKPIDSFAALPPNGCWPLTVTFTDYSTDVTGTYMAGFEWSYGDGAVGTGNPSPHTYTAAGSFGVTEIVTDNIGCKDTMSIPSMIAVTRPHAVFTVNNTAPCAGDSIHFTNLSSNIVTQLWIFGDSTTDTAKNPPHVYYNGGSYTVKMVVVDSNGCRDTASYAHYINVSKPNASFYATDSFSLCPPLSAHFVNTSTGAIGYHWSFGNGDSSVVANPSELYTGSGLDTVLLVAINAFGCRDTAVGHINLYGYAGAFSYTPDSGCAPLRVFFNAGLINVPSIIWDFADGVVSSASSLDTITHVYIVPGEYVPKLILSDLTGCQNSSLGFDTIRVDTVYPGFTTIPNPVCVNDLINFKDTSHSYFSSVTAWNWHYCDSCFSTLSNPSYTYFVSGTYPVTLTASDAWGCNSSKASTITVMPPPNIKVSSDTTVCLGDPATLTASGGINYTWGPAATLSCTACNPTEARPTVVTQYTVNATDANGCKATDTITVKVRTKTISNAFGGGEVCQGVPQQLYDTGATKYTWIPAAGLNHNNIPDPVATPEVSVTYTVIAQYAGCIPDTNYITVKVNPLPRVATGPGQTIVDGASANLSSTGTNIFTRSWTPSETLNCDSCADPIATPPSTTTYYINVRSLFGCTASDSVLIKVICDASQIFIPNSFTPNNDGVNDVFYPRGTGISQVKSFRIYNRWGELLFEKDNFDINDVNAAWNGSYMGGTPRPDVYVYVFEGICSNGEPIMIKGDVTIIK